MVRFILLIWLVVYCGAMYFFLQPFSIAHYWQTLNEPELSGQIVIEKMKYERFSHNHSNYKLALKGQDNAPSLLFDKKVLSSLEHDLDSTLLDYGKVWKALEKTNINDTISVKWIARTNKQPIFTSINNQSNIGLFTSKKGIFLIFNIVFMIGASIVMLLTVYFMLIAKHHE